MPAAAHAAAWVWSTPPTRMLLDDFLELSVVTVDPLDAATARAVGVLAVNSSPLLAVAPDVAVETLP